ncbi:MAG: hypothetical protein UH080_01085 [Ruminococcus sp.]|nr:hypothetical protein [Ruminococcus sp.]
MKKTGKKDTINLFFSAFLILAFIVCAHFFTSFANTLTGVIGSIVTLLVYVVFGLLVFYATRVGEGKAIVRFSPLTLLFMVLPALYIMIASMASGLPFHDAFVTNTGSASIITTLAAMAFGYGIPYSFLSGFEIAPETEEVYAEVEETILEGGIEADLAEAEKADEEKAEE